MWWMSIFVWNKDKNVRILIYVYALVCRCMQETKILKSVQCDCMCTLTPRQVLIPMRMAMYFWGPFFLSRWPFVSVEMWRYVWGRARARDWNNVQPEGRTREGKKASPLNRRLHRQPCDVTGSKTQDSLGAEQ